MKTQTKRAKRSTKSSLTIDVIDVKGKKKGTIALPKELFDVPVNNALIAQAVRVYLTNQRQSSAKVQTRGDVTGSGKKIYRQKGTGRARHGDRYAGIFVGGGKAHGPRPRVFEATMNRKMKASALYSALTARLKDNCILVVDGLEAVEPKTKQFVKALSACAGNVKKGKVSLKTLIAIPGKVDSLYQAGKNVENVTIRDSLLLNTYEVMNHQRIVFTRKAIEQLAKRSTS